MDQDERELIKQAYKAALKEWLDEIMAAFGRWSLMSLLALIASGIGYVILTAFGWHK